MNFYLSQLFSLIAWIILAISFWKNKNNKILYLQVFSCLFFGLNYILIGAWTGLFVVIFEIIRDYLYIKYDDDKKTFLYTLPIYIIIGVFGYNGITSLFSILAALNDGYSLIYKGNKLIFLSIITYTLWLIYDISFNNYVNTMAEIIIIISNSIILIKGNKENAIMRRS